MNNLLVINAGSSSIKFAVFRQDDPTAASARGIVDGLPGHVRFLATGRDGAPMERTLAADATHAVALSEILGWIDSELAGESLVAAGHRVVHGGTAYAQPVRIDAGVMARLMALVPLAELHQPHNLAGIRAIAEQRPGLPQIACFDTAFHAHQDPRAQALPLPRSLSDQGVRRYGFHGLSYEYVASVLPAILGAGADGRVIVAHLGAGASLCAMRERRSIASTMGFTALDGLMMGTRPGAIDPGVLLYLLEQGYDTARLRHLLYHECGLLGVSGISSEMRVLLASNDPRAREAIELFCYRAVREIGSLAAVLGGLDALVFTGGIGEHAPPVRACIAGQCAWLGVALDAGANARNATDIGAADAPVAVRVIPTNEESMIARHTAALL